MDGMGMFRIGMLALAGAVMRDLKRAGFELPENVQTCNISDEEKAERDRPKSRQERRQLERLRRKGRA